jgi:hypothetical protein
VKRGTIIYALRHVLLREPQHIEDLGVAVRGCRLCDGRASRNRAGRDAWDHELALRITATWTRCGAHASSPRTISMRPNAAAAMILACKTLPCAVGGGGAPPSGV